MKLVFFGDNKLGLIKDKTVVDLSGLVGEINAPTPQDLINTVISEFDSRYRARFLLEAESATGIPIRDANLHAPLPRPGQIVAMAANYLEDGALKEPRPINAFFKSPESVIGNGDTVVIPPSPATIFHHEAELGIVIGKVAENVPADQLGGDPNFQVWEAPRGQIGGHRCIRGQQHREANREVEFRLREQRLPLEGRPHVYAYI